MSERKPFPLRLSPVLLEALQHWADDELRSLNGHIEFLLRKALKDAKRMQPEDMPAPPRGYSRSDSQRNKKNDANT